MLLIHFLTKLKDQKMNWASSRLLQSFVAVNAAEGNSSSPVAAADVMKCKQKLASDSMTGAQDGIANAANEATR